MAAVIMSGCTSNPVGALAVGGTNAASGGNNPMGVNGQRAFACEACKCVCISAGEQMTPQGINSAFIYIYISLMKSAA